MKQIEIKLTIKNVNEWNVDWETEGEYELNKLESDIKSALNWAGIESDNIEINSIELKEQPIK